jgi:hypothetical protein
MFCGLDICKHLYSGIGGGKGGREEGRLKAEMRMRARLRKSWRGVMTQPQNQPTAWFRVLCRKDCVFYGWWDVGIVRTVRSGGREGRG